VDAFLAKAADAMRQPDLDAARLPGYAFNLLTDHPNLTTEEHLAELRAVTLDDLRGVARDVISSSLLMVPHGLDAAWAGFTAAPTTSDAAVDGTAYPSRSDDGCRLILGPAGASLASATDVATVRFRECAALLKWPDGGRVLLGDDGISVRVEPTLYAMDPGAVAHIDAMVDPGRQVRMPARPAEAVPQPAPKKPDQPQAAPAKRSAFETVAMWVVGLAALAFVCLGGLTTLAEASDPEANGGTWGVVGGVWCVAVVLALPTIILFRRWRAARA
jgi:hypothetical protein